MKILLIGGPKAGCLEEPGSIFVDGECHYVYDHGARAYVVVNGVDHAIAKFIEGLQEEVYLLQAEIEILKDEVDRQDTEITAQDEQITALKYELVDERAKNSNQTS